MIINFIKILIIFSFFIFLLRHISYFYHKYKKLLIEDSNSKDYFFYQTPPLIITFYLMIYFCDKNLIYWVLGVSVIYLIMLKSLYYFIPFFPNNWRIRFTGGDSMQLLLLLIYYLIVTIVSLKGIENGAL
tara:strand:- start:55 stop:444 length:390 start_codon:yes stop_codon:yes gene_type:complete